MDDLLLSPKRQRPQALHVSYEKSGLTLPGPEVPWNAEAVIVEALIQSPGAGCSKNDFRLLSPQRPAIRPETLVHEVHGQSRLVFRLPTPSAAMQVSLHWKQHNLGQLEIPVVGEAQCLRELSIQWPTLHVQLGEANVACQTTIANQVQGLIASAMVSSPTALAAVADLGLQVEFSNRRTKFTETVAIHLSGAQRTGRQALITATPSKPPKQVGEWQVTWHIGGRSLAQQRLVCVSRVQFQKSLQLIATRLAVETSDAGLKLRPPPFDGHAERVGPCFIVASHLAGPAGLCTFQVTAQSANSPPATWNQTVLIADGPALIAPGLLDADDAQHIHAFELNCGGRTLGVLPMTITPHAEFDAEGGYKSAPDFLWSPTAEDELNARLGKLFTAPRSPS